MRSTRLVVVGASLAGIRAVEAARRTGFDGRITLIGGEPHVPYDRPPLSKAYLNSTEAPDVRFRTAEELGTKFGTELLLGAPATGMDAASKVVTLVNGEVVEYDALVIATGAVPRSLPFAKGLAGVHTLRTLEDAIAVRRAMQAGARTVVVGAGFIGSEVASAAHKRGLSLTVLEAAPAPLTRAIGAMSEVCVSLHQRNGVDLRCGVGVESIDGDRRVERVQLNDGTAIDADLVVVGIGASPATTWLEDSGVLLDDGVVCDETLWTGLPGVYAAGDVTRWYNPLFNRDMRLEHWTSAGEQGALAARNALAPSAAKPYETVPYFWSDWYDSRIQFVGVPVADEVVVVEEDIAENRIVALYRADDRLVGAFTLNKPAEIMKYRGLIARRSSWTDAMDFAAQRQTA